ncbi:ring finger protein, transmembrane 2 isoform X2 [Colletes latitarsis]|uniref:ring finger protein, transmembrane 2 isoform X2 n=1 Tax=Colletes latitarsis TaxID=2605962 RepID=UPI0040369BD0
MPRNVQVEEIINIPHNSTASHITNENNVRQSTGLLMTHSSSVPWSTSSISIRDFNFNGRTVEHSRIFPNNVPTNLEETRPFIEYQPGVSLNSLLNIQRIQNSSSAVTPPSDNHIINVEDQSSGLHSHDVSNHDSHHHQTTATDNFLNNIREAANEVVSESQNNNSNIVINHNNNNNNNNNNTGGNFIEALQFRPEIRALLEAIKSYMLFIPILLIKGIYDYRARILNFTILFVTFYYANSVVKREIGKRHNKNLTSLLFITCCILGSTFLINFEYDTHIFSTYTEPLTVWELLWSILITDFILKLFTIVCKIFLTCLPAKLLPFRTRGKYYVMVEATSQLYRCGATIQPWLYYFFDAYQGPEKILGVFLSVLYTMNKGYDLLCHAKLFQYAIWQLFKNVVRFFLLMVNYTSLQNGYYFVILQNIGESPSKEELIASGDNCTICHERYSMPVRLHCKHIFCETCVLTWLDKERSCPLCRADITQDPTYRDGHTTNFIQLY